VIDQFAERDFFEPLSNPFSLLNAVSLYAMSNRFTLWAVKTNGAFAIFCQADHRGSKAKVITFSARIFFLAGSGFLATTEG
jgi:hypothetical protein